MKKRLSLILIVAVVAGQLGWLGYNYHARSVELEQAPVLTLPCDALDPRDIYRGDYVRFSCRYSYPLTAPEFTDLLHWEEYGPPADENGMTEVWVRDPEGRNSGTREVEASSIASIPARKASNPASYAISFRHGIGYRQKAVAFWRPQENGPATLVRVVLAGSALDVAREGELRTPVSCFNDSGVELAPDGSLKVVASIGMRIRVSDLDDNSFFRFYVPENTGEPVQAWLEGQKSNPDDRPVFPANRIRTTVDFLVRPRDGLVVKQVYLNGIPWVEAIEKMRNGTFPLMPQPAEAAAN